MSKFSEFLQPQMRSVQGSTLQADNELPDALKSMKGDIGNNAVSTASAGSMALITTLYQNSLEVALGLREKTPLELFKERPCEGTLRNIPKREQTPEMVLTAVESDGMAIKSASKKLITEELCRIAVSQNGLAIRCVPEKMLTDEMVQLAVKNTGLALYYLEGRITKPLAELAVRHSIKLRWNSSWEYPIAYVPKKLVDNKLVCDSVSYSPCSLKNIPIKYITQDLVYQAVSKDCDSFAFVPSNFMSNQLIELAITNNPANLRFVPLAKRSKVLCERAFQRNPFAIKYIPVKFVTTEMCLTAIEAADQKGIDKTLLLDWLPETIRNNKTIMDVLITRIEPEDILTWNTRVLRSIERQDFTAESRKPLPDSVISQLQNMIAEKESIGWGNLQLGEAPTSPSEPDAYLVPLEGNIAIAYDLCDNDDTPSEMVYYISDLHIEHQLQDIIENCSIKEFSDALDNKIQEMILSVENPQAIY